MAEKVIRVRSVRFDGGEDAVAWMGSMLNAVRYAHAVATEAQVAQVDIEVGLLDVGEAGEARFTAYSDQPLIQVPGRGRLRVVV